KSRQMATSRMAKSGIIVLDKYQHLAICNACVSTLSLSLSLSLSHTHTHTHTIHTHTHTPQRRPNFWQLQYAVLHPSFPPLSNIQSVRPTPPGRKPYANIRLSHF